MNEKEKALPPCGKPGPKWQNIEHAYWNCIYEYRKDCPPHILMQCMAWARYAQAFDPNPPIFSWNLSGKLVWMNKPRGYNPHGSVPLELRKDML